MIDVEKQLLTCIICYEICKNAVETNCCSSLLCEDCGIESIKHSTKCPYCRQKLAIHSAIAIRKIIGSIRVKCPLCSHVGKKIDLTSHIKEMHIDYYNTNNTQNDNKLFKDAIKDKYQNITHKHELTLQVNPELTTFHCSGKKFFTGCSDSLPTVLIYTCKQCDIYYCTSCACNTQTSFKVKNHIHHLKPSAKQTNWFCDFSSNACGCKKSLFLTKDNSLRFRCDVCDYDLCEYCFQINKIL
jgi:hypothetical protein